MDQKEKVKQIFDQFSDTYSKEYMGKDLYNKSLERFCSHIHSKKATLIELACGPGNITQNLLEIRPDLKILGIDISPKMISLAKKNVPSATFIAKDVMTIHDINLNFDAALSGFCYPYLSKKQVLSNLKQIFNLLNKGGTLYISTISGDYKTSKEVGPSTGKGEKIFMYYYDQLFFENSLKEIGFTILEITHEKRLTKKGDFELDIIIIASK